MTNMRSNICYLRLVELVILLALFGAGQGLAADNYTARLTEAARSYARGDYATALPQWLQLASDFPEEPQRDLALLRTAQCAIAGKHWEQAARALTALRAAYPRSTYRAETAVLLYATELSLNKLPEANALWQEIFTQWPQSPYELQVAAIYLLAPQIPTGEQEKVRARQVLALEWDELLTMLYPPSLPANRVMDTLAAHEHCCALLILANAPLSVILSEVATFRAIFSADDMEVLFQLFKKALDAGDTTTARRCLNALNTVSAAHPRSLEARKLYRQAQAAKKSGRACRQSTKNGDRCIFFTIHDERCNV